MDKQCQKVVEKLLRELLHGHIGKARIDVPAEYGGFHEFLDRSRFAKTSEPPIMVANAKQMPARAGTYYGIAAQIFG